MSTEAAVAGHYGRRQLEELILAAVAREGKDPEKLTAVDLAAVDEFHVGGLEATQELARHMELRAGLRLLDMGSGLGGPALLCGGTRLRGHGNRFDGRVCACGWQFDIAHKAGWFGGISTVQRFAVAVWARHVRPCVHDSCGHEHCGQSWHFPGSTTGIAAGWTLHDIRHHEHRGWAQRGWRDPLSGAVGFERRDELCRHGERVS